MSRNLSRFFLIAGGGALFLVTLAALVVWSGKTTPAQSAPMPIEIETISTCSGEDDEDVYLGDGAFADWNGDDLTVTDATADTASAEIVLFGADEYDKLVHVTAAMEIGYLRRVVLDRDVDRPPQAKIVIPLTIENALSLHPRQKDHVTRLSVELTAAYEGDANATFSQNLVPRYLALNPNTAQIEVMSAEVQNERYPLGVVNQEEQQAAVQLAEDLAKQGIRLEAVGSGVHYSTSDPEDLTAFRASRTVELGVGDE